MKQDNEVLLQRALEKINNRKINLKDMINYMIKKVRNLKYTNCTVCNKKITKKNALMRISRSGAFKVPVCDTPCK